jgi:hypothetical protein
MNSMFGMLEMPLAILLWIVTGLLSLGVLMLIGIVVAAAITSIRRRKTQHLHRRKFYEGVRR